MPPKISSIPRSLSGQRPRRRTNARSRSPSRSRPGYYLYREQFKFAATARRWARRFSRTARSSSTRPSRRTSRPTATCFASPCRCSRRRRAFTLAVNYQGCADKGLCYPPAQMRADVSLGRLRRRWQRAGAAGARHADRRCAVRRGAAPTGSPHQPQSASPTARASRQRCAPVASGPSSPCSSSPGCCCHSRPACCRWCRSCPRSSSGHGRRRRYRRGRGFALAASYSLGMALVYTALGVAAGLAGEGLPRQSAEPVGAGRLRAGAGAAVALDVRRLRTAAARGHRASRSRTFRSACRAGASPACSRWAACRR